MASINNGISTGVAAAANPSSYYANNSLLGGRPNDESVLSDSSDGPSLFTDEEGFERNLNSGGGGGLAGGKLYCASLF